MSGTMEALAHIMLGRTGEGPELVLGTVTSGGKRQPLKILAEGTLQEREDLLRSDRIDPLELVPGDKVVLWPIEERQRYVILARVVAA